MIYGFMHVYQVHNWNEIVEKQLYRMKKSGLWDKMGTLFIGLVGKEPTRTYSKKIKILYHIDKPKLYEALTLTMLHLYSQGFDGRVFYIHTKGVSRNSPEGQTDWRRMMEHYILDRYKTCWKELENNDIVGCNWHLGEGFMSASSKHAEGTKVTPHFSGAFWWANTDYIKKLPILYPLKSKYECEFWIGKANPKVAELWHSGIHHQRKAYPESNYIGKLSTRYFIGKEEIHNGYRLKGERKNMSISRSQNRDKKILSELKSVIEDLGVDYLPTFGGKYEGGIHLQQIAEEIAPCIYDLMKVNTKFKNFLEIGSAAGGNTYLFNHFFNFDNITIIDDNRHKKYALRQEVLKDIPHSEFIGNSHSQQAIQFLENLQCNYDIIFIDGDHSYEGIKKDFKTFKQFLNHKGFIILHDTVACTGVKQFSDELKEETKLFNPHLNDIQPIKLLGDYIGKDKKLGITVFQIYSIPKWREKK